MDCVLGGYYIEGFFGMCISGDYIVGVCYFDLWYVVVFGWVMVVNFVFILFVMLWVGVLVD